jgi:hypothetical protein
MTFVSAQEITLDVMSQIDDIPQKQQHKILRMVIRAIAQMNMKYNPRIKTEMFQLTEALTVTLPEKALRPIKTGKVNSSLDRLDLFDLDQSMHAESLIEGCVCNDTTEVSCAVHTFYGCCFGGMSYASACISGPRLYIGTARWKMENNTIYYDTNQEVGEYVLVEYESQEDDAAVIVPEFMREIIIARVMMWLAPSQYTHQQLRIEIFEAKRLMVNYTYEDLIKAMRGSYSPKKIFVKKDVAPTVVTNNYTIVDPETTTIPGPYFNDAAAAANGVAVGEQYYLSADNEWGEPFGAVRVRTE